MPRVPAICSTCGLMYNSTFSGGVGSKFKDCTDLCPRCHHMANVVNGYFEIIGDTVAYILDPDIPRNSKIALIAEAKDVANRTSTSKRSIARLEKDDRRGAMLLRDWVSIGIAFVGAMGTIAGLVLQHFDRGSNSDPIEFAYEQMERHLHENIISQPPSPLAPFISSRPKERPLSVSSQPQQADGKRAHTKSKNENRKARRARAAKSRERRN